jgi:hypothetical protein
MLRQPKQEAGDRSVSADERLVKPNERSLRPPLIIPRARFPFIPLNQSSDG